MKIEGQYEKYSANSTKTHFSKTRSKYAFIEDCLLCLMASPKIEKKINGTNYKSNVQQVYQKTAAPSF